MTTQFKSVSSQPRLSHEVRRRNVFNVKALVGVAFVVVQISALLWFHTLIHVKHKIGDNDGKTTIDINDVPSINKNIDESKRNLDVVPADGNFNSFPFYEHKKQVDPDSQLFHSWVHCTGDNFSKEKSWMFKQCHFRNICFDTQSREFVIISSHQQDVLEEALGNKNLTYASVSTAMKHDYNEKASNDEEGIKKEDIKISIGGINPKWAKDHVAMKWFPTVKSYEDESFRNDVKTRGIYVLSPDVVMVPYHSFAGFNPGHLVWDDFLPIYSLLTSFDLLQNHRHMLLRYVMPDNYHMWASCDRQYEKCRPMLKKFVPLMGVNFTEDFSSVRDFRLLLRDNNNGTMINYSNTNDTSKQPFICAPHGVAGMGMATDHGMKRHGWAWTPSESVSHNLNRGASLYGFRNFMLNNIGVSTEPLSTSIQKHKIVFSVSSSSRYPRNVRFIDHIKHLKNKLSHKYEMDIVVQKMSDLSVKEQAALVSDASVYITANGGGAVSGIFLPRGASLFLFFHEEEGDEKTPARLDWDFFNHASWLRTHWLPRPKFYKNGSPNGPLDIDYDLFVKLMDQELDIISHL